MNANELRIGNYFHPCDTKRGVLIPNTSVIWSVGSIDKFGKIAVIDYDKPNNIYLTVNECSPIPLTEEWLQKFGFEEVNDGFGGWLSQEYNFIRYRIIEVDNEYVHYVHSRYIKINHVHKLQNLMFTLTGNELQIK